MSTCIYVSIATHITILHPNFFQYYCSTSPGTNAITLLLPSSLGVGAIYDMSAENNDVCCKAFMADRAFVCDWR